MLSVNKLLTEDSTLLSLLFPWRDNFEDTRALFLPEIRIFRQSIAPSDAQQFMLPVDDPF